jgi:hypothetical protein
VHLKGRIDFGLADRDPFVRCSEQAKLIGISIAVLQPIGAIASVAKATAPLPIR